MDYRIPQIVNLSNFVKALTVLSISFVLTSHALANGSGQLVQRHIYVADTVISFEAYAEPEHPATIAAETHDPYEVQLNWAHSMFTDTYILEMRPITSSVWQEIYRGPQTSFRQTGLSTGTHRFRIFACGSGVCSSSAKAIDIVVYPPKDTDSDSVPDYLDVCPGTSFIGNVNSEGCSSNQLDSDDDGVADHLDLCPGTPTGATVSAAGCVPTTLDSDNDGVTDDLDRCTGTVLNGQSIINDQGCDINQIDSDGDNTPDHLDPYPLQSSTQCAVPQS